MTTQNLAANSRGVASGNRVFLWVIIPVGLAITVMLSSGHRLLPLVQGMATIDWRSRPVLMAVAFFAAIAVLLWLFRPGRKLKRELLELVNNNVAKGETALRLKMQKDALIYLRKLEEQQPGGRFSFWDICTGERRAKVLIELMKHRNVGPMLEVCRKATMYD